MLDAEANTITPPALPPSLSLSLFLVLLFTLLALPSPLERDRAFARLLLRLPPSLFHRPRIAKSIPNANRAFPRRSSFFVSFFERSLFEGIGGGSRGSRNRRRGRVLGREDGKLTKRRRERGRGKGRGKRRRLVSGLAALGGNSFRLAIKHGWAVEAMDNVRT